MGEYAGQETRWLYLLLLALVVVERQVELRIARRNTAWALARGGVEVGRGHYPVMVALHTAFLVACVAEVWLLQRAFVPWLAAVMLAVLVAAMALRYWVIATLGRRWTTRVICLPGEPVVAAGPYRFLRHPNYLAVVLEILALPLVHTAWLTAAVFSLANAWLLKVRIDAEEAGLRRYSDYDRVFAGGREGSRETA